MFGELGRVLIPCSQAGTELGPPGGSPKVLQTAGMDGCCLLGKKTNPDTFTGKPRLESQVLGMFEIHPGCVDICTELPDVAELEMSRVPSGSGHSSQMEEFCSLNQGAATCSSTGHPKGQSSPKIPAWGLQEC